MKEICIINYGSNAAVYGIGTYIREYIHCLENLECKINLIEIGTDTSNNDFYIKTERNVRTIHIPGANMQTPNYEAFNKGICRFLRLYIEDSENLVFHFQYSMSGSLLDEINKYYPLSKSVFTIHYMYWSANLQGNVVLFEKIISNQNNEKIKTQYGHIIENYKKEKAFMEKTDQIVCLSEDTQSLIQKQYGIKQNVWFIPNGLRKNFRSMSEHQKTKLRSKCHIDSKEKILLYIGRIDPNKGIEHLMGSFNDVIKEYPTCRLVIIGSGDMNGMLKKCKNAHAKVTFTGRLDKKKLYQWYQIADIALFPSFHEECSYVGIEMMMYNLPIVASDGYGVKNMFYDDINAKVARIENLGSKTKFEKNLKQTILNALNSDLDELAYGAKKMYNVKYSIEKMQQGYKNLFNSL